MVMEAERIGAQQNGASQKSAQAGPWRWTVEMYRQAGEMGWFEGRRVELVNGEIIEMMPMGPLHIGSTTNLTYALIGKLPSTLKVLTQMPITLSQNSAPIPDVSVINASVIQNRQIPTTAHLVAEVADSSARSDRTTKAALYASAQIPEYWILDVNARTLEVLREPMEDSSEPLGWRYGHTQVLREDATVAPLCAPDVTFTVREMLP